MPRQRSAYFSAANFSATASVSMNSLTLIGLVRYRKNSASKPLSISQHGIGTEGDRRDVRRCRVFSQDA